MQIIIIVSLLLTGYSSRYDPGVFQTVIRNRQSWGQLPTNIKDTNYIALADCNLVGTRVLVCYEDCWFALVADCAGIADGGLSWMQTNNIAGEVDNDTAMREGCLGKQISVYTLRTITSRKYEFQ